MEGIFHEELKGFFANHDRIQAHLTEAKRNLSDKETALGREIAKVKEEMTRTHRLYLDGHVTAQALSAIYKPAEERLNQLQSTLPKMQAEADQLRMTDVNGPAVLAKAATLYDRWPTMPTDDKRKIAKALVERIVIGEGEIDIMFSYLPTSEELCKNQQQLRGLG